MRSWAKALPIGATLLVAGCHSAQQATSHRPVRFIVSSPGAFNYGELLREYAVAFPGLEFQPLERLTAVGALEAIQDGEADLGFNMMDLAYLAFSGRLESRPRPFQRLRAIAALGVLPVHLLVQANVQINSVNDLAGHTVGVGLRSSEIQLISRSILAAFGLDPGSVHLAQVSPAEAADRLRVGSLEAAFFIGAYPADSVETALRAGAHLVRIQGPSVERLRHGNRFIRLALIPSGTYAGQNEPVPTIGVQNLLLCRSDLDEGLVYELTKRFFLSLPRFSVLVDSFRLMDLDLSSATSVPLHDGAARYYRERELFR